MVIPVLRTLRTSINNAEAQHGTAEGKAVSSRQTQDHRVDRAASEVCGK